MLRAITRRQLLAEISALSATSVLPADVARGSTYPDRPLRVLVGGGAGSVPDLVARLIGDKLSAALHQPVVIENRPGASGIIAMQALVSSLPDGYTLALATMSQLVFNSYLYSKLSYDPTNDVDPISTLATVAMVVAAHPSVPASTFSEFVSLAKAQPGKISVGTAGVGSPPDVVARLLMQAAKVEVPIVPFRTGPDGMNAVIRGDVQLFVDAPPLIAPQAKSGNVKALVVTGRNREKELPDVETIAEAGFSNAQGESWFGLVAPARTPAEIETRLNSEIATALKAPDLQSRLAVLSFRPFSGTLDEFRMLIRDEHKRWGPLIREAGIKLD